MARPASCRDPLTSLAPAVVTSNKSRGVLHMLVLINVRSTETGIVPPATILQSSPEYDHVMEKNFARARMGIPPMLTNIDHRRLQRCETFEKGLHKACVTDPLTNNLKATTFRRRETGKRSSDVILSAVRSI